MHYFSILVALPALAFAHPAQLVKRFNPASADDTTVGAADVNIVNFALTLEHLETAFYSGALANFTAGDFANAGYDGAFYENVQRLAKDEATHADYLTTFLQSVGATPVPPCVYSFPYTTVDEFVGLAAIIEGVGVGAYSGAASSVKSGDILTVAAGVLPIEARHNAILRAAIGEKPFPSPFDIPLDFNQVYSLATPFFVSCPYPTPFGLKPFSALSVAAAPDGGYTAGSTITLVTPGYTLAPYNTTVLKRQATTLYAAFLTINGPIFTDTVQTAPTTYSVKIPADLSGQNYVVLSSCKETLLDANTLAGPAIVEISA